MMDKSIKYTGDTKYIHLVPNILEARDRVRHKENYGYMKNHVTASYILSDNRSILTRSWETKNLIVIEVSET